jgi:hypothetical protein
MNRRSFALTLVLQLLAPLAAYALPASSNQYYAALDSSYGVLKVDPATGATLGNLFASPGATDIELGPDGLLYICNPSLAAIQAVDRTSGVLSHTIQFPLHPIYHFQMKPLQITFGPDGRIYASVSDVPGFGNLYAVEPEAGATPQLVSTTFAENPSGLEFGPDGDLYVTALAYNASDPFRVERFDGTTGAVEATVASSGLAYPTAVTFAADGTFFVGSQGLGSGGWITHHTVDGDYLGMLPVGPTNPYGLSFLPDGDLIWGNTGSTFKRYDFATQTVSDFGSGFVQAVKMIAIPEPTAGVLVATAALTCARRRRAAV